MKWKDIKVGDIFWNRWAQKTVFIYSVSAARDPTVVIIGCVVLETLQHFNFNERTEDSIFFRVFRDGAVVYNDV